MKKKSLALLLVMAMIVSMLTACGGKSEDSKVDTDKEEAVNTTAPADTQQTADAVDPSKEAEYHATLMYFVASDSADQSLVNDEINKLAKEQLNMTIDLLPVTLGTYSQQIQLMLSGGEPLDVFPIFGTNAGTYIESQYIVNLADTMYTRGKGILENVGEDDVWCSSIGDFVWGVTTMRERANPCGLVMRTDILNEVGVKAEELKTLDDITSLYEKVSALHPEMTLYGGAKGLAIAQIPNTYDTLGDSFGVLMNQGQTTTVTNWYESEEFKNLVHYMRDWFEKGYTSQDMPTSTDSGEVLMRAGNLFSFSCWVKPNSKSEKDAMTGYDTTIIQITEPMLSTSLTAGLGYAIANNSEKPERAMDLLNWLYSNKEVNDLLNWGVEGTHWTLQEDGTINYPEGVTAESCGYHQDFGWALPNQFISHVWNGNNPNVFGDYQSIRDNAVKSKAYGFSFNTAPVINEIAAVTSVSEQYLSAICTGSVDPESAITEFNQKLYEAGLQKIIDEKQTQLDAWLASKAQ